MHFEASLYVSRKVFALHVGVPFGSILLNVLGEIQLWMLSNPSFPVRRRAGVFALLLGVILTLPILQCDTGVHTLEQEKAKVGFREHVNVVVPYRHG